MPGAFCVDIWISSLPWPFTTKPGDPLTNDWTRRTFDVTQFRGQTIRVAFIEQDSYNYFNVALDDISVRLEEPALRTRMVPIMRTSSSMVCFTLHRAGQPANWFHENDN